MSVLYIIMIIIAFALAFYAIWKKKTKFAWLLMAIGLMCIALLTTSASDVENTISMSQEVYVSYTSHKSTDIKEVLPSTLEKMEETQELFDTYAQLQCVSQQGFERSYDLYCDSSNNLYITIDGGYYRLGSSSHDVITNALMPKNRVAYDSEDDIYAEGIKQGQVPFKDNGEDTETLYFYDIDGKNLIDVFYQGDDQYQVIHYLLGDDEDLHLQPPSWSDTVYVAFRSFSTVRAFTIIEGFETEIYNIPDRYSIEAVTGGGEERQVIMFDVKDFGKSYQAITYNIFSEEKISEGTEVFRRLTIHLLKND